MTKFNNQELQAIGKDSQVIYLLQIKWNDQNNEKKKKLNKKTNEYLENS